jgi:hypothetical protein
MGAIRIGDQNTHRRRLGTADASGMDRTTTASEIALWPWRPPAAAHADVVRGGVADNARAKVVANSSRTLDSNAVPYQLPVLWRRHRNTGRSQD